MNPVMRFAAAFAVTVAFTPFSVLAANEKAQRVVSIGGSLTEIVFALGQQDRLVARDTTSAFPSAASELPDIGYMRALSPEGVLSTNPDLIIATEDSGPPETIDVLKTANVEIVLVPEDFTMEGVVSKIGAVAHALDVEDAAQPLIRRVRQDIVAASAAANSAGSGTNPKVLFVLGMSGGRIMAAGQDTAASSILNLSGAQNALQGFSGYKPVTDEAIVDAAPDIILMMDRMGDNSIGNAELFAMPAISATPAGQNQRLVRMDGLHLLGFGLRTASAITELAQALHVPRNQ